MVSSTLSLRHASYSLSFRESSRRAHLAPEIVFCPPLLPRFAPLKLNSRHLPHSRCYHLWPLLGPHPDFPDRLPPHPDHLSLDHCDLPGRSDLLI